MEYIGNGMKTEKSLILDIKNIILKIVCPNGKCIYNKKAMFNKFIEKIHENLKKLNQLGINVKSLNVNTKLFFFLEISKKFLICNGDERMINTINYMVNFYVNSKFIYGFSKAGALLGNYLCPVICTVGFSFIGAYTGSLIYDYITDGQLIDICKYNYLFGKF